MTKGKRRENDGRFVSLVAFLLPQGEGGGVYCRFE